MLYVQIFTYFEHTVYFESLWKWKEWKEGERGKKRTEEKIDHYRGEKLKESENSEKEQERLERKKGKGRTYENILQKIKAQKDKQKIGWKGKEQTKLK